LAGYDVAYFDDFRVEVIERDPGIEDRRNLADTPQQKRPRATPSLPDPREPAAAARPTNTRPR
jgi:hypothetical protein